MLGPAKDLARQYQAKIQPRSLQLQAQKRADGALQSGMPQLSAWPTAAEDRPNWAKTLCSRSLAAQAALEAANERSVGPAEADWMAAIDQIRVKERKIVEDAQSYEGLNELGLPAAPGLENWEDIAEQHQFIELQRASAMEKAEMLAKCGQGSFLEAMRAVLSASTSSTPGLAARMLQAASAHSGVPQDAAGGGSGGSAAQQQQQLQAARAQLEEMLQHPFTPESMEPWMLAAIAAVDSATYYIIQHGFLQGCLPSATAVEDLWRARRLLRGDDAETRLKMAILDTAGQTAVVRHSGVCEGAAGALEAVVDLHIVVNNATAADAQTTFVGLGAAFKARLPAIMAGLDCVSVASLVASSTQAVAMHTASVSANVAAHLNAILQTLQTGEWLELSRSMRNNLFKLAVARGVDPDWHIGFTDALNSDVGSWLV